MSARLPRAAHELRAEADRQAHLNDGLRLQWDDGTPVVDLTCCDDPARTADV